MNIAKTRQGKLESIILLLLFKDIFKIFLLVFLNIYIYI